MGMFDYVSVNDARFVCSEGHPMSDASSVYGKFQTKDFECTLGEIVIAGGRVSFEEGPVGWPHEGIYHGTFRCYAACVQCPGFVQLPTGNLIDLLVEFEVEVAGNVIFGVRRVSDPLAKWLAEEPTKPWMTQHEGPMPFEDAVRRHQEIAFAPRSK